MIHVYVAAQLTVRALKEGEIIDQAIIYGLSIRYREECCSYFRMTVDYVRGKTVIEDFGAFSFVDALNDVVARLGTK